MFSTSAEFVAEYKSAFSEMLSKQLKASSKAEQYEVLVRLISERAGVIHASSAERQKQNHDPQHCITDGISHRKQ